MATTPVTASPSLPREPAGAGSERRRGGGFTIIELLVVVAIIAIATAGVSFALRDTAAMQLERDAQRLAAQLEAARAQSRASGLAVRWQPVPGGFRFDGLDAKPREHAWLAASTQAPAGATLVLGPEPILAPQAVTLSNADLPDRTLVVATDGLRPFAVGAPAAQ